MQEGFVTAITRRYHFESAHWLPRVPDGHRCKRLHGHNYELEVTIVGPVGWIGFVLDFWDLDKLVQPIISTIDHRTLNELPGLENPTAELIAAWFLRRMSDEFPYPTGPKNYEIIVRVYETKDCWATVALRDHETPVKAKESSELTTLEG